MKSLHLPALLAATVLGGLSAQAQVEIKISGSTAFRAATYNSIVALYGANLTTQTPAGPQSGAGKVTFVGTIPTLYGIQSVTIKTAYSGSVEGVINLLNAPNPAGITQPTYLNADGTTDANTSADFALCDVFQDTTDYNSGSGYANLDDVSVGIVAFAWTKGTMGGTTGISNLTHQQASALLGAGSVPLSILTGNAADAASTVYLAGRNKVSGTRIVAQSDTGYGANADSSLYKLAGNTPTIDSVGFSSGSSLAAVLNTSTATGPFVAYLGISDSNSVNGGNNRLTFNGVPFSFENVRNGAYSFWSYEHIFARPGLSNTKLTLLKGISKPGNPIASNGLAKAIDTNLATSTTSVQVSTMKVVRNSDGGPITGL